MNTPILQIMDGDVINKFYSVSELSDAGYSYGCVYRCINGERKTHKKFQWVRAV